MFGGSLFVLAALAILSPKDGGSVALLSDNQRKFLSMSAAERTVATRAWDKALRRDKAAWAEAKKSSYALDVAPHPVELTWSGSTGAVRVVVARAADGRAVFDATATGTVAHVANLEVGTKYVWSVTGTGERVTAAFTTDPQPPRLINGGKVANFRDLGGWMGLGGRRVRQGRLFRSAEANRHGTLENYVDDATAALFRDQIGLRTDIDLRNEKETAGMTNSPFGSAVAWRLCPISPYYLVETKRRDVFEPILDPARHPVVFHCAAGKDRTATVAFLTLALLGVSEDDIWRDYQMTGRSILPAGMKRLADSLRERHPADSLAASAERYFLSLGFTARQIQDFRKAMLED